MFFIRTSLIVFARFVFILFFLLVDLVRLSVPVHLPD